MHTGQHYDDTLSRVFFAELGLAEPDRQLGIGGGSNTSQTARMLARARAAARGDRTAGGARVRRHQLDARGRSPRRRRRSRSCTSRPGCARTTARCPRSCNRVLTDHLSELLLCSSEASAANLRAESVAGRIEVVGDVMVDVSLRRLPDARADTQTLERARGRAGRVPAVHGASRRQRRRSRAARALVELLLALPGPVVLPLHPRTRARLDEAGLLGELERAPGIEVTEPLGYVAVQRAAVPGPRGRDRLGGRPEGGVPCRGALHHAAREHRVGRDRRGRLEHACGPRRRRGARGARAHAPGASVRRCTGTGTRPSAVCRRSGRWARDERSRAIGERPACAGGVWRDSATGGRTSRATSRRSAAVS